MSTTAATKKGGLLTRFPILNRWFHTLFHLTVFLFCLHLILAMLATFQGPFATVRETVQSIFWVPADYSPGQDLPPHQFLIYTVLTELWALPFWRPFWDLFRTPALPLLLLLLKGADKLLGRGLDAIALRKRSSKDDDTNYRPVSASRFQQARASHTLNKSRQENKAQARQMAEAAANACLVQILNASGCEQDFHLMEDLAIRPIWSLGNTLAPFGEAFRNLVISRDDQGSLGLFRENRPLWPLHPGTVWLRDQDGILITTRTDPAREPGCWVQLTIQ